MKGLKKMLVILLALFFVVSMCVGCSDNNAKQSESSKKEPMELSFAVGTAVGSNFEIGASYFAKELEKRTNGDIKVKVYPSSQLGNSREMAEGVQMGTIDFTSLGLASLGAFVPETQVLEGPFLFETKEHAYKFLDSSSGQEMLDLFTPYNFKALAWWENGLRHLTTKQKVVEPKDMKGIKLRCQEIPLHVKTFNALGALATPMQWVEVYTGLQQGTIDGQENPLSQIYTAKIYEVTDYLALTGHIYAPAITLMSQKTWEKLSKEQQEIVLEVAKETAAYQRAEMAKKEKEYLKNLQGKIEIVEVDRSKFKEAVMPVYDWYLKEYPTAKKWIDAVNATK